MKILAAISCWYPQLEIEIGILRTSSQLNCLSGIKKEREILKICRGKI